MLIKLRREDLLDLQISMQKEYLLTNGKGGYCSSTILDCHTRKYHGLLVLPIKEQGGRIFNLLSKLEPVAIIDKKEFHLSTNKFPNVYDPTGHKYVTRFEMEMFPETTYQLGDVTIVKSILMPDMEDTVLVKYDIVHSEKPILFKVKPLFAFRDIHSLSKHNMDLKPRAYFETNGFKFDPYKGLPPVYIQTSIKSMFYPGPEWWYNFEYIKERNRGYEYQEDLFCPGIFELKLKEGQSVIFRTSLNSPKGKINAEWEKELERAQKEKERFKEEKEPLRTLKTHASQYIISYPNKEKGIVAGYHWFNEWGRDTLISLAGLTLCMGEYDTALSILKKYTKYEKEGQLPNIISPKGNHSYNSVDTPLLYFWAVQQYIKYSKDKDSVEKLLLPTMINIISGFLNHKIPYTYIGEEGFVYSGTEDTQLTWMDAMVNGKPVTPRNGAAVEINALWYNALCFLQKDFGKILDKPFYDSINTIIRKFESNFENKFFSEIDQDLVDLYWNDQQKQLYIRPNQLFAIGLPYTCISYEKALIVLKTVEQHLATPFGLRTLSPRNPKYRSEYNGDPAIRDMAYHMGMIWPWLMGIYTDALLKHKGTKAEVKIYIYCMLNEFNDKHLEQYGLFHISELFRPSPPHVAKGCIAQAWSMAEIIRALEMLK